MRRLSTKSRIAIARARASAAAPPVATAPFPIDSVQGVASRAWELCLKRDPLGLIVSVAQEIAPAGLVTRIS